MVPTGNRQGREVCVRGRDFTVLKERTKIRWGFDASGKECFSTDAARIWEKLIAKGGEADQRLAGKGKLRTTELANSMLGGQIIFAPEEKKGTSHL